MNVSLTPELKKFVEAELESGLYKTPSQVISAGLCALKAEKKHSHSPRNKDELEARLIASVDRMDRGLGVDGEDAMRRLRRRIKAATRE
jgi:putative addiction module CopG family antidote